MTQVYGVSQGGERQEKEQGYLVLLRGSTFSFSCRSSKDFWIRIANLPGEPSTSTSTRIRYRTCCTDRTTNIGTCRWI